MTDETRWTLVWLANGGDYYVGETAVIYRDGEKVWEGYSADEAANIARAFVGDALEVRFVKHRNYQADGRFPADLADVREEERPVQSGPLADAMASIYGPIIAEQTSKPLIIEGLA